MFIIFLYNHLKFCSVYSNSSFFIPDFNLYHFSFFLGLVNILSLKKIFPKNQLLVLSIPYCFCIFYFMEFYSNLYYFLLSTYFKKYFIYLFVERGGGRGEKEQEKHRLVASHMHPDRGPNRQPRYVPWMGIKPVTFRFVGQCQTNWATPVRAFVLILGLVCSSFFQLIRSLYYC